ncbi:fec operon regulator FecR [compost metagenome]
MQETEIENLIQKYDKGQCTPDEIALLETWYEKWNSDKPLNLSDDALMQDLLVNRQKTLSVVSGEGRTVKLWPRIAIAAAVLILSGIGLYFFNPFYQEMSKTEAQQLAGDIAPGKNKATLTLDDGKTITLNGAKNGVMINNNKLTYEDGTALGSSMPSTKTLTAATPRGGTYQVTLPDGSRVWLNAATKLKFPSTFEGSAKRSIELDGEAYFEITKDSAHPFIVSSKGQEVEVLGTHFNVNAYTDEPGIKTALLEGSVKVRAGTSLVVIKPGQQTTVKDNKINVEEVNVNATTDWKNGKFRFKNEPLGSILRKVSRWYDVEIVYESTPKNMTTFSGSVSRFDNVSAVLKMLEETSDIKFSIEGKTIKVQ